MTHRSKASKGGSWRPRAAALAALLWLSASLALPLASQGTARLSTAAPPPAVESTVAISAVGPIGMTVSDMDRAVDFYSNVLSFQKVSDTQVTGAEYEQLQNVAGARIRVVRMRLGSEEMELSQYLAPRGRPVPLDSRSQDRWFQHIAIIVSDMDEAYGWLRAHDIEHASSGPQRLPDWNPNAGGIKAFYFKDPDHHTLEILQFPAGKGDPKWHRTSPRIFLGIDHTAIVTGDTPASLAFYRDLLGMRIAGESENYGVEQERLNNVVGARLRITALRAVVGPGVELLEYLAPRDGRPYPADARSNDLLHWETTVVAPNAAQAARILVEAKTPFLSQGVVQLAKRELGFEKAFLVRDPDGHVVRIVERR
jgi:catechol 2,3-dioxygenase-like lactoylglutathione lyase family enzyme